MQAGGRRFESDHLHQRAAGAMWRNSVAHWFGTKACQVLFVSSCGSLNREEAFSSDAPAHAGVLELLTKFWRLCGLDGPACPSFRRALRPGPALRVWLGSCAHLTPRVGDQVRKGIWWMPWHREAMKDVARCDKPRGVASKR